MPRPALRMARSSVSGTSMAVPQVLEHQLFLLETDPDLEPADVKRLLLKTADELAGGKG